MPKKKTSKSNMPGADKTSSEKPDSKVSDSKAESSKVSESKVPDMEKPDSEDQEYKRLFSREYTAEDVEVLERIKKNIPKRDTTPPPVDLEAYLQRHTQILNSGIPLFGGDGPPGRQPGLPLFARADISKIFPTPVFDPPPAQPAFRVWTKCVDDDEVTSGSDEVGLSGDDGVDAKGKGKAKASTLEDVVETEKANPLYAILEDVLHKASPTPGVDQTPDERNNFALTEMGVNFVKWTYRQGSSGRSVLGRVMGAPKNVHGRLTGMDRKLWSQHAQRRNTPADTKGQHCHLSEQDSDKSSYYSEDYSQNDSANEWEDVETESSKSASPRKVVDHAAVIAKGKATMDDTVIKDQSSTAKRAAHLQAKSRRAILSQKHSGPAEGSNSAGSESKVNNNSNCAVTNSTAMASSHGVIEDKEDDEVKHQQEEMMAGADANEGGMQEQPRSQRLKGKARKLAKKNAA
ncbi:hypothetical protein IQ07DRAFT_582837 [Pyrenochaeta sp. DS3sAY3a]|nr:hypothetical protein IQ07DRAFT_582837 [Pyrenochaeta sp. DS3sAY3a]